MGEITLTTFLLQEVLWELRALLVVLVPLAGFGVLLGEIKDVRLFFGAFVMQCCPKSYGELCFFQVFLLNIIHYILE